MCLNTRVGATPGFECLPADNNGYLTNTRCDGSQAILSECQYSFANGCNQKNGCEDEKRHSTIQCKPGTLISKEKNLQTVYQILIKYLVTCLV